MEKLFKNSKRWMASVGVVAFLMVAGWQVGADGRDEVFAKTEVALENAVAGSGGDCPLKINNADWYWDPTCECILWYNNCYCGPGYC